MQPVKLDGIHGMFFFKTTGSQGRFGQVVAHQVRQPGEEWVSSAFEVSFPRV